ncbi:MAG: ABC transporter substrate-binding protein, partial [Caldilinea sp.]
MSEPRIHPLALTAVEKLQRGRINRREFLRYTTLLGVSVGTAYALAGCAPAAAPASVGAPAAAGGITRGGTLRKGMLIQQIDHPARLSWVEGSNAIRLVNEYLTETGPDNITRPSLLESWEASDDVKTWTLKLRQGIKFNNGDDLTADDVLYSFSQWLDPEVGSSMLGLLSYLDGMNSVEKVDDYTIRLNLASANIGV